MDKDDIDNMFPGPTAPRGPGGDIYGLDSWRQETSAPQYTTPLTAVTNPISRIAEQARRERNLDAVKTWGADLSEVFIEDEEE